MSTKKFYLVTGGMGQVAVRVAPGKSATAWTRKRYGTGNYPYVSTMATPESLADHLQGGAMVFEADGSNGGIVPKEEAFAFANIPIR